ncbi:MAG: universal stress protein [Terriglobales bacterium]
MSRTTGEFVIRRILVALDASAHSLAALQLAADLAANTNAELTGLFVEDTNLLRLARAPHAREIYASGQEAINSSRMEKTLRAQAEQARQALMAAAERAQVASGFRVVRGEVTAEVLAAASEADLLTVGRGSWFSTQRLRLGSTAIAISASAPGALLLVEHGIAFEPQALVLYDGTSAAQKALRAAEKLVQSYCESMTVLLLAKTADTARAMEEEVTAQLEHKAINVQFRRVYGTDVLSIVHAVQAEGGGILVIGNHSSAAGKSRIQELFHHLHYPILLVH